MFRMTFTESSLPMKLVIANPTPIISFAMHLEWKQIIRIPVLRKNSYDDKYPADWNPCNFKHKIKSLMLTRTLLKRKQNDFEYFQLHFDKRQNWSRIFVNNSAVLNTFVEVNIEHECNASLKFIAELFTFGKTGSRTKIACFRWIKLIEWR